MIDENGVMIDNAMVTAADIVTDNGVVHVIDAVLLPETQSNLQEYTKSKYLYSVDLYGKIVNPNSTNQIIFDVFESGKTKSKLILNK
ncbi:MAG: hypothetical protein CMP65_05110 [Flavobacteriales bacterium]|nr:hypothetical protein [Flavobacteriales bacterium]